MSGHSHFATIKRQKGLKDAAKGNTFGKLSKNISIAIKSGGGTNPDMNFKLRIAIDKAKEFNMPKDNIDRILKSAESKMENIDEITYEGFGPFGVGVLVEVVTDNKNRSAQEFKNIFEKAGGNIAGPGAVSYNFEQKGILLEDTEDGLQLVVKYEDLKNERQKIEDAGFTVIRAEIAMIPKNYVEVDNPDHVEKVTKFLETLEDHDDVQKVYSNF
jgi:transcriptional/translational regulatory protein YebC/TACO1